MSSQLTSLCKLVGNLRVTQRVELGSSGVVHRVVCEEDVARGAMGVGHRGAKEVKDGRLPHHYKTSSPPQRDVLREISLTSLKIWLAWWATSGEQ